MVTFERVFECFLYEAETGCLIWRDILDRDKAWNARFAGKRAGTFVTNGNRHVVIDFVAYPEHRIIWLLLYGRWPAKWIDHISGNASDNRIDNLREADAAENQQNRKFDKRNTSGFTGVHRSYQRGFWYASISVRGKRYWSKGFATPEEAHDAYLELKKQHHSFQPTLREDHYA